MTYTTTTQKEELELQRTNITPAQFCAYVRQKIRAHKLECISAVDIDLQYWAAGKDLNFDIRHATPEDGPVAAEKSVSRPYEMQSYVRQWNGDTYNHIMEFTFTDEKKGVGYFYFLNTYTPDAEPVADAAAAAAKPKAKKAEAVNKYGVQVGDIFCATWGYEQTNNDFFQVVEVVGTCSVRVREVYPQIVKSSAVSSMSEDRVYNITRDILPAADRSVFIDDQERGDLKKLKSYAADGISDPCFKLSSYADAHLVPVGEKKVYESWYY